MRIIAPANNNKHYIIQSVSLSLIDFKATKSPALASRVLRLHQTPLTKVTDFSSKQQQQLNHGMPQAEDRQGWGKIQQQIPALEVVGSVGQSVALPAEQGNISHSSVLYTTKFLRTSLTEKEKKNPSAHQIWKEFWPGLYKEDIVTLMKQCKILRCKFTCWVLSHLEALQLWPISDTHEPGNKTTTKKKQNWREMIMSEPQQANDEVLKHEFWI